MVPIARVLEVFRAVYATTVGDAAMLAITAVGGVLRRAVIRMLGIGDWTSAVPLWSVAISTRVTVRLFVASGIKSSGLARFVFRRGAGLSALAKFFQTTNH